ncbi:hypothetical protein [Streptomyces swartbergensis]|uniref:hypothetical protein n=1 Tax=Streptomyces swartbergensis TaxID=487165 RepID=UPI003802EB74
MATYDRRELAARETGLKFQPTVIAYSRLEPIGLTSGDLGPGLEALIADPLWMVGRQWQFEELRGEDGGSPVLAEVHAEQAEVTRFHPGSPLRGADPAATAVDHPDTTLPLAVAVEAEQPVVLPERVRAETGMQLLRLTRAAGLPKTVLAKVEKAYLTDWPFEGSLGAEADPPQHDPAGLARRRVVAGRVPDGARAAKSVTALRGAAGTVDGLPPALQSAAGTEQRRMALRQVLSTWLAWAERYVAAPVGTSWDPHRLEYSFAVQAGLSSGDVVLRADEYGGRTLDWHSFDASAAPGLGAPATPVAPEKVTKQVVPTPVRYPGMPSDRLWAFEDARVHLGGLKAGATDLARLALVEFALVFGNDWFLVPFPMKYGEVAAVQSLKVVDTFGKTVTVRPSRETTRPGWTAFQHTGVGDGSALADVFFLPATVRHALQGPPLEEVALFRDEMANLVWGVERIVQGAAGEPVRRGLVESRSLRQQLPADLGDAAIVYRLMTPVPEHWVPFVSVPVPHLPVAQFATELERWPMVRFVEGRPPKVAHPQGVILRADPGGAIAADRLRIAEEEVPREGAVITRRFQLTRTTDGDTLLWVGRRKEIGQGEGSAGLKFDTALPPGGL